MPGNAREPHRHEYHHPLQRFQWHIGQHERQPDGNRQSSIFRSIDGDGFFRHIQRTVLVSAPVERSRPIRGKHRGSTKIRVPSGSRGSIRISARPSGHASMPKRPPTPMMPGWPRHARLPLIFRGRAKAPSPPYPARHWKRSLSMRAVPSPPTNGEPPGSSYRRPPAPRPNRPHPTRNRPMATP